jgi:hypothetical protein
MKPKNPLDDPRPDAFGPDTKRVKEIIFGATAVALRNKEYTPLEFAYALAALAASPGSVKRFAEDGVKLALKKSS